MLFQLVSRRYQNKSTLITTNRAFGEWNEVFPNAACVVSLVDRLVHNAEIVAIEGNSYRLKEARDRADARARSAAAPSHDTMPDHLRPIMVEIPVTWTAEQALAVYEMLNELREKIWACYSCQLQDLLAEQQRCAGVDDGDTGSWTIDF